MKITKEDRKLLIDMEMSTEPLPVRKLLEFKARCLTEHSKPLIGEIPELTMLARVRKNGGGFAELHADPPNKKCQYWRVWVSGCPTQYGDRTRAWYDGKNAGIYAEEGEIVELVSYVNGGEHSAILDLS